MVAGCPASNKRVVQAGTNPERFGRRRFQEGRREMVGERARLGEVSRFLPGAFSGRRGDGWGRGNFGWTSFSFRLR